MNADVKEELAKLKTAHNALLKFMRMNLANRGDPDYCELPKPLE